LGVFLRDWPWSWFSVSVFIFSLLVLVALGLPARLHGHGSGGNEAPTGPGWWGGAGSQVLGSPARTPAMRVSPSGFAANNPSHTGRARRARAQPGAPANALKKRPGPAPPANTRLNAGHPLRNDGVGAEGGRGGGGLRGRGLSGYHRSPPGPKKLAYSYAIYGAMRCASSGHLIPARAVVPCLDCILSTV
jgi:hypothetical protein